jgi:hypothetical protein
MGVSFITRSRGDLICHRRRAAIPENVEHSSRRRHHVCSVLQVRARAASRPCGKCFPSNRVRPIAGAATAKAPAADRIGTMPVKRTPNTWNLVDVFDRVLDKGVVIAAWVRMSIVGIDLITIEARLVVASIDSDVEILYDRRQRSRLRRRHPAERRMPSNVDGRTRRNGFAVVRPAPPPAWPGLTRWTA